MGFVERDPSREADRVHEDAYPSIRRFIPEDSQENIAEVHSQRSSTVESPYEFRENDPLPQKYLHPTAPIFPPHTHVEQNTTLPKKILKSAAIVTIGAAGGAALGIVGGFGLVALGIIGVTASTVLVWGGSLGAIAGAIGLPLLRADRKEKSL